jgi:hypothetical protein
LGSLVGDIFWDEKYKTSITIGNFSKMNRQKELPRLLGKKSKSIKRNAKLFAGATTALVIINVALNIILQGALADIIGRIVKFQLIVHLLLVPTPSPANVMAFYKTLIPIVTFELIPTFSFFNKYMPDLDYDTGISETFILFEYDMQFVLPLLGFMLITLLLIIPTLILS